MTRQERRELGITTVKRTLVAFFFGFVLSAMFALAIAAQFTPLVKLERESIDFGVRIANAVFGDSADEVPLPGGASPILMVDVDAEACATLASEQACKFDKMMQPEVVTAIMEVVDAVGPEVAVLDVLVTPEAGDALREAMGEDGQPLLTAMELSEFEMTGGELANGFLLEKSLCGAPKCGRLEYLPARALTQDGKARYYERSVAVTPLATLDGQPSAPTSFPTLAYRAAALADAEDLWDDGEPAPQIGYTLPSFALDGAGGRIEPDKRRDRLGIYDNNIEHYLLSSIKDGKDSPIDIEVPPPGSILIVGSTAASGGDLHNTPVGPMGGMEVVANAIRSFQLAAPEQVPGAFEAFLAKISTVLKALLIIALVEGFLAYFSMKRDAAAAAGTRVVGEGAFWDRWSLPIFLSMILAFAGEFLLTTWEIINQLHEDAGSAGAVDVIWPIVGVTISAIIGFSGEIIAKLEWLVDWVFDLPRRFRGGG